MHMHSGYLSRARLIQLLFLEAARSPTEYWKCLREKIDIFEMFPLADTELNDLFVLGHTSSSALVIPMVGF